MRNVFKPLLAVLAAMPLLFVSCDKNDIDFSDEYMKSLKEWSAFKESSGNSYKYTVDGISWVGVSWETVITVTDGTPTRRDFRYTQIADDIEIPEEDKEWSESGDEVNSRTDVTKAVTLDEVYELARREWLIKRKDADIYFKTENDGIISLCGYVPHGCQDDCFRGIDISSIEKL